MNEAYRKHRIPLLINVSKIVTVHYFEFDSQFRHPGEQHDFWELVYADKGECNILAGQTPHVLHKGEAYFHKPNEFHRLNANGVTAPNIFIISFVCSSKAMAYFEDKKIAVPPGDRHFISAMIEEANNTYDLPFNNPELKELKLALHPPAGGVQMIKNYLEQFLIRLIRAEEGALPKKTVHPLRSTTLRIVPEVIRLLEQNIYGQISVAQLCAQMNFSRAYIARVFAETTGYSVNKYYTALKIEEAKRLIRENHYNFTEISDLLRFSDPQYFSRVFKRVTRMTPTKYSESVQQHSS